MLIASSCIIILSLLGLIAQLEVRFFSDFLSQKTSAKPAMSKADGRIYVGNLPPDTRVRDLEDLFCKFGKVAYTDLKNYNKGPPFAFVEFDDARLV